MDAQQTRQAQIRAAKATAHSIALSPTQPARTWRVSKVRGEHAWVVDGGGVEVRLNGTATAKLLEGGYAELLTPQEKAHIERWFFEALASHQTECPERAAEQAQERAEDTLDWPEGEDNQDAWIDAIAEWCTELEEGAAE